MAQIQKASNGEGNLSPRQPFASRKPAAEGPAILGHKAHDALIISIRQMAWFAFSGNGAYSAQLAKAAEAAKLLDGEAFRGAVSKFRDVPSVISILSLCSLLPEKAAAREYAAISLYDKKPNVQGQAARAIIDGFFLSDFLLPAIRERICWDEPELLPHLHASHASLSERYAALRRSAFVEMADVYSLGPKQHEIVKLGSGGIFAKKFGAFYTENKGWTWIYDRSL
ncbi:Uncharacterised protein [uncultured archaeon]|nr:Uncharacterised protein [uncultured archaeon]